MFKKKKPAPVYWPQRVTHTEQEVQAAYDRGYFDGYRLGRAEALARPRPVRKVQ